MGSARSYMFDTAGAFWDAVSGGRDPSDAEWRDLRIALLHTPHACKEAVTLLYEALGTTGVYTKSPLDRHLRDVTTLAQHVLCQTKIYAAAGRVLLGLPSGTLAL